MTDAVNHPSHYMLFADGTESIDVIKKVLTTEEFIGFCKGNVLKYRLRAGKKDALQQDIDKAETYARMLAEAIEEPCGHDSAKDAYPYVDKKYQHLPSCNDQRKLAGENPFDWGCSGCINVTCESNAQYPGTSD